MKWLMAFLLFITPAFTEENNTMTEKNPVLKIETNMGSFEVTLFPKVAPKACENFIKLSEKGFYNGVTFHRIIPQFMIQGGDPTGTGAGGQSIWGKKFEDECKNDVKFSKPGLLAMANSGKDTNGSQFFITTAKTDWLNMHHTIFGEVTQGYDVVQKIEALGSRSGTPKEKVQIIKVTQLP